MVDNKRRPSLHGCHHPSHSLLRPAHASPNDARQLLVADTIQQPDGKPDRPNNCDGEACNQPELDADVLLLAHVAAPVDSLLASRALASMPHNGAIACADEAVILLGAGAVPVDAKAMARAVRCCCHATVFGGEARRDLLRHLGLGALAGSREGGFESGGLLRRLGRRDGIVGDDGFGLDGTAVQWRDAAEAPIGEL